MVTSIVVAVIVLGFLIVFHEFGHFWVARRCGVGVVKFSIGFGPKLVGTQVGPTEYVISAIPLGGFVKMIGEDPDEEVAEAERSLSFNLKPLWKRSAIVLAGPLANILLAFFAFVGVFALYGAQVPSDAALVGGLRSDMPAAVAGMKPGDKVVALDGQPIATWEQLAEGIRGSGGKSLRMTVVRDGAEQVLEITPKAEEEKNIFGESVGTAYLIGIERGFEQQDVGVFEAVGMGASQTWWWMKTISMSLVKMVQGSIPADQIGGPIMIVQAAGEQAERGLESLLHFLAVVSINLGILNLLPIPILDGGHLFFFAIEGILRRPLNVRHREIAQQVGLAVLITLMAFAFYNDIVRNLEGWWG